MSPSFPKRVNATQEVCEATRRDSVRGGSSTGVTTRLPGTGRSAEPASQEPVVRGEDESVRHTA